MKTAPFSASVWPLAVLGVGVVVATACVDSRASAAALSSSSASPAAPSRGRQPRYVLPSRFASEVPDTPESRPKKTDHTIFGPPGKLQYYGGPVISNVHAVLVEWTDIATPTDTVDPTVATALPGFFSTVTTGPYFSWLAEYNTVGLVGLDDGLPGTNQTIGYGTVDTSGAGPGNSYVITPTVNTTTTVDVTDIQSELAYQIGAGYLPIPEMASGGDCTGSGTGTCVNTLYVVDFPPGVTTTIDLLGDTSCKDFCGYHFDFVYGSSDVYVPFAVLIDVSSKGCSGCGTSKDYVANAESIHSHELVEAVTDTAIGTADQEGLPGRPIAWYDATDTHGGEAADICEPTETTLTAEDGGVGYTVQLIWSNANAACIAVAPDCTATSPTPPSCTPCTAPGAAACTGTLSVCQTEISSPAYGWCVACATDSDCSGSSPICDQTSYTCRACKASDCKGKAPICAASGFNAGQCVQCTGSDTSACPKSAPFCDTVTDTCAGCLGNMNCSGGTPICDTMSETCRACASDSDCSPDVCNTSSGACVQCLKNSDCTSGTCDLSSNTCQCATNSQCTNPQPICGSGKTCIACTSNGQCTGSSTGDICNGGSCVQCTKNSDCKDGSMCNTGTDTCEGSDGGTEDSGPPPAKDGGTKSTDAGPADGGSKASTGSSGGCATSPASGRDGPVGGLLLAAAGLAVMGARRRGRKHSTV